MKQDVAMQWVDALESGKYKQGEGLLVDDGKYCCLGVLCEIVGLPPMKNSLGDRNFNPDINVLHCSGLKTHNGKLPDGKALTDLNDNGMSFKEIAKIIKENYEEL